MTVTNQVAIALLVFALICGCAAGVHLPDITLSLP